MKAVVLAASLPNAWTSVEGGWLAFTQQWVAACANHSCGAVAESHRASRAFRIGTSGWV